MDFARSVESRERPVAPSKKLRVLVVDDSAIVRRILSDILLSYPEVESVNTASDARVARNKIMLERPDVVTLDLDMPETDGLTFLKEVMREQPLPVIIVSSLAKSNSGPVLEALRLGALDVLAKPGGPYTVAELKRDLAIKIRGAATAKLRAVSREDNVPPVSMMTPSKTSDVIAIAASTGGVQAIEEIVRGLPKDSPGILIVQHIPAVFSAAFANRLDKLSAIQIREAAHGDEVTRGVALVAPGDRHLKLHGTRHGYRALLSDAPPVHHQRPSADVLFDSVAEAAGASAVGVILTGMGSDGAEGLRRMRYAGARTIAQDAETCVVFGMPRAAIRRGAAGRVLSLSEIAIALQTMAPR